MWLSRKFLSHFFYFRLQLAFYSLQKMTRTEHVHKETRDLVTTFINANGKNDGQVYFRFNVEDKNARVRLDDWEKMRDLQGLAIQYMGFENVVQKTKTIAAKLKKIRTKEQTRPRTDRQGYDYVVKLRILADSLEKVEALIGTSVKYNFVSKALVDKLKIPVQETSHTVPEIRFLKGDKVRAEHESWISFSRDGSFHYLRDRFYVLNKNPVPYELIIGSKFVEDQGSVLLEPPPLSIAAKSADEAVIKRQLEQGVDVEARDWYGRTPLVYAIYGGNQHIVQLLLENGAHVAVMDSWHNTPLHNAASKGHEDIVKLLLEKGADIESGDINGRTPLFIAVLRGNEAVAKLLLEKGANIEAKTTMSHTPLLIAALGGHEAVVKLLLEKGADIEARDQWNNTPLFNAISERDEAVVKLLLEKGADANAIHEVYKSPLSMAANTWCTAIVELLLERGAHTDESNLSQAGKKTLRSISRPAID
ncbi:Ankyrin repeat domain-containing protein 17 [Metarhizium anisopliae]